MLPWQERVVEEAKDLEDKIDKLILFTNSVQFPRLSKEEQFRLKLQCRIMGAYAAILRERIQNFT